MVTIRHLLQEKGKQVWSVAPEATLTDALRLMDEKDVGALLVLDKGRLVGILSERDFARKVAQADTLALSTPVSELMTDTVYYLTPDHTIDECMELMTVRRIRHLPVLEAGSLVGIISIGDVVKEIISDRDSTIRGLENYITGREYIS